MNKRVLLLPSASLVPEELRMEFGSIPSAFIPLSGRPAMHHIASPYIQNGYKAYVILATGTDYEHHYADSYSPDELEFITISPTPNLGETLLSALSSISSDIEHLVVNFADTQVDSLLDQGDCFFYSMRNDSYRWTSFQLDSEENISKIEDPTNEFKFTEERPSFVGVFSFSNCVRFTLLLQKSCSHTDRCGTNPFYIACREYYNGIAAGAKDIIKINDWNDLGHVDNYFRTKKSASLKAREFNLVELNHQKGIIKKRSSNTDKFIDEIQWYLKLPKPLQYTCPRILDYSTEYANAYLDLEFYSYPSLDDMYLYGSYNQIFWKQVLLSVTNTIKSLNEFKVKPEDKTMITSSLKQMYLEKTISRIDTLKNNSAFDLFFRDDVTINDRAYHGLQYIMDNLDEVLKSASIYDLDHFNIIHGDLCFSNILYDRRNQFVRIIDPRGRFGNYDIYGDYRYDLAKLSHSISGKYDFVVNNLVSVNLENDQINYKIHSNRNQAILEEELNFMIETLFELDMDPIKLIEGLLFLSMTPLHKDNYKAQIVFLSIGIERLNKYLGQG